MLEQLLTLQQRVERLDAEATPPQAFAAKVSRTEPLQTRTTTKLLRARQA